jgi:hypothetical protein
MGRTARWATWKGELVMEKRVGNNPSRNNSGDTPVEEFTREAPEVLRGLLSNIARLERLLRQDRPRGVLPSVITARPKSRGALSLLD